MRRLSLALLGLAALLSTEAQAAPVAPVPAAPASATPARDPDLLSFGLGYMDFDKTQDNSRSADYRFEYRFGYTFIGGHELGFHPFLAFESSSLQELYGLGGFNMDWNFANHGVFTWGEGIGYLDSGHHRSMGGTMQFRSQAEVGYRFDNDMRITAQFGHISNAKTTRINPGSEIIGAYVHIPTTMLFGCGK